MLPDLCEIVPIEAKMDTFHTLYDLIQLLLIYEEINSSVKRVTNAQFDLLPVIYHIAEELLQNSKDYER
jgi:hypothetical protein